uniref:Uncharacterized protein n=1 Tax=Candidatus Methanogaster sp. ANME-2c ERB4 TaxID=2759911 RepID=A0A7G9YRB6_9EURY|nr:hypothetical protein HGEBJNHG_00023 [Methanosarcinales archaeon ANME-2c ERB4]
MLKFQIVFTGWYIFRPNRATAKVAKTEDRNQEADQQIWAVTKNPKKKKDSRSSSGNLYFTYSERL